LLGREIARFVFGPDAEAERAIANDPVIQAAVRLVRGVSSPDDLLSRVEAARSQSVAAGAEGTRR
jgi:hypothetical protein